MSPAERLRVHYTLFSRGRPIGETELGFPVSIREARFGWFVPNAEGERLMPLLAGPSPAILAYMQRSRGGGVGEPGLAASDVAGDATGDATGDAGHPPDRTFLADAAEAAQYQAAFELELRRPDGTVVPTSHIGLQDTEHLRLLGRLEMEAMASDPDVAAELAAEFDEEVRMMVELDDGEDDAVGGGADDALLAEWWAELDEEPLPPWSPDDEITSPPGERYQIYVALTDESALP